MIDFKIIGDYEPNQCVKVEDIRKSEPTEFYWHSSQNVSYQDTDYESHDIKLYHSQADMENINQLSEYNLNKPVLLNWDLSNGNNLEGYASDPTAGSSRYKFLFYRITKDIMNNSSAIKCGVIPFIADYTTMIPSSYNLSGGKYYINLYYDGSYIVMDGSVSSSTSSGILPKVYFTTYSISDIIYRGTPFTMVLKQYNSLGNVINRTELSGVIPNSNIYQFDEVSWVDGAVHAKLIYESSGTEPGNGYTLYGYPEDMTTAVEPAPAVTGSYQVKVPSWSVAYGRFLLGYSSISSGDTSPSKLLNAYLYQLSVNGNSVNGAIGSDEVGKYIYMGYSRINTTAPLTAYVRYRTNSNGTYSSWSSWINIANSDINSTRYVKIFQLTEDMSKKIIEIQMSDSKSVSDDF